MTQSVFSGPRPDQIRFIAFLGFLLLCLLGGGGSRPDIVSLLYLRPAAIICIAILFLVPGPVIRPGYRVLFLMLAGLAAVIAIQLIPLPPGLWSILPHRELYAEGAAAIGAGDQWRPISLTPDLTWNSLVALLIPAAALVGFSALRPDQHRALLAVMIGAACASAVLGIVQLSAGDDSAAYLYEITHSRSAVGFFSNRNHEAAFLAMGFPMLRLWTLTRTKDEHYRRVRVWIAVGIGLLLVPMILVTGSRAGMALGLAGLLFAVLLAPIHLGFAGAQRRWAPVAKIALIVAPVTLIAAAVFYGRALAIDRFVAQDPQADLRLRHLPVLLRMVRDFFPVGTGFGSFDPVFRGFEPDAALSPFYFNRAHNDLIELALTGGLPALILLVLFLIWWFRSAIAAFFPYRERTQSALFARLGTMMILMLFAASLVDYPLRTPLMSVVFVIACGWVAQRAQTMAPPPSERPQAVG
jgi:O-antigen ligase